MGKRKKTYYVKTRKWKGRNKVLTKRSTVLEHVPNEKQYLECITSEQKIGVVKQEHIEMTIESCNDDEEDHGESRIEIETLCETQVDEELWVVRRQLCRCCHSDGAFWSLQTMTEGDTYGDLLQTYFNIQLCPVSKDELALSAICALCAARLRDARAFSAQAHAAEERFTRLYKQNRVRALVNAVVIRKDVPKIVNEVDDLVTSDDDVPDTVNSDIDNPEVSTEELAPKLNKNKDIAQVRCYKNASRKNDPQASKEKFTKVDCDKPAPKKLFHLSPSDYQRNGSTYKCTRCDKLFIKRINIHSHVKNVHFKSRIYTCPRCDKTFRTLCELNCHKKYYHSIDKEKSKNVYELSPSDFERIGKSYKCTRCEKQYKSYAALNEHVMYKHLKLPRYTCSHCDKTFHCISPFNKHKLLEHSIDDRIKCNACDWFTYDSISKLKIHMNIFHMLGKKQTCPDCDYICFNERSMRRHAVKHSTVKEHHCKFCKKSFLRKSNLAFHERIHTGDKRKVCNVCGQAFVQRASLTYHMAKHHPEVRF